MRKSKNVGLLAAGFLAGVLMGTPTAQAAVEYLQALPSQNTIYVDGQQVEMEAYIINGTNFVKLRDIGQAVGFNVYWDGAVQIDSTQDYTGQPQTAATIADSDVVTLPTDGSRYKPEVGDQILCPDGSTYTVTDVSRWDKNAFASGPAGKLPEATCNWSSFPEVDLPAPEVRHYQLEAGDYLFVRNLYETRRMQYALMNLAGNHPQTGVDGKLKYGSKGTPAVRIQLTVPSEVSAHPFWPWRESEIANLFNSCPPGTYYLEVWDVFKDGVFQRTEYNIKAV